MKKSESTSACMHKKIHEKGQGVPVFSHKNQNNHPDPKKQISKCWKLVIDPLDSHPLSHNISPWTGGAFGPGDQPPAFRPSDAKLQRLRLGDADGRSLGLIISRWVDGRAIKRYGKHNIRFQTFQTRV